MTERCEYDDNVDESCLQIDCNNRGTEEAMKKLSINAEEGGNEESNDKCPTKSN